MNSYFPDLKDLIEQIKNNVQNEQLNSILGTISSQVGTISNELSSDLPRLEEFLESQMQSYKTTEAEAEAKAKAEADAKAYADGLISTEITRSDAKAKELAEKTVLLFGRGILENGDLHEYYDPENGNGVNNLGFQNWNLLVNNMIAELEGKYTIFEF